MIKHITVATFRNKLDTELALMPINSVIKSIGTNQTHFIILVETPDGREHKIYIPCEEDVESITAEPKQKREENKSLIKDSDVIKALECCQLNNIQVVEDCNNCPFNELPQTICQNLLAYHALQIIKRGIK